MGSTHFQMKTLKHVGTEMALHVLAYNIKRVIEHFGRWRFDGWDPGLRQAAPANWLHQPLAPVFLHSLDPFRTSAWPAGNLRLSPIRPFLKDGLAR